VEKLRSGVNCRYSGNILISNFVSATIPKQRTMTVSCRVAQLPWLENNNADEVADLDCDVMNL